MSLKPSVVGVLGDKIQVSRSQIGKALIPKLSAVRSGCWESLARTKNTNYYTTTSSSSRKS